MDFEEEKLRRPAKSVGDILRSTMNTGTRICADCGCEFTFFEFKGCPENHRCEQCLLKLYPHPTGADLLRKQKLEQRRVAWEKLCPKKYRTVDEGGETDETLLPADKMARMLGWYPSGPKIGIALHGVTGKCKTRAIWRLMRRYFMEGKRIVAFDCSEFSTSCITAYREGREDSWRRNITTAGVVLFDDLWKDTFTERVDSELFSLIEKLSSERIPYFITTNYTGNLLEERARKPDSKISLDRLMPLLRRVREDLLWLPFGPDEAKQSDPNKH